VGLNLKTSVAWKGRRDVMLGRKWHGELKFVLVEGLEEGVVCACCRSVFI